MVKLYVAEADSPYFLQLIIDTDEPIVSSAPATTEVLCVLYRKEQARALKPGAAKHVFHKFVTDVRSGRILTIPYGRDVEVEAEKLVSLIFPQPRPVLARSLDVIHISTALSTKAKSLAATDARLREVAGLSLIP